MEHITFEHKTTDAGIEITVRIPAIRIVDTSHWPEFTAEWAGQLVRCKWISRDCVQVGNSLIYREE